MPADPLHKPVRWRALERLLARFRRARGGNVAIMFALVLLPLIGVVGGALDYGIALSNRSSLQDAADAAALAGAQAANAYVAANGTSAAQVAAAQAVGNTAAQNVFAANIRVVGNEATPVLTINTTLASSSPTTVMTAQGTYVPFLLRAIGINSIPMSVSSTSTMTPTNRYFQIIFVVDVSNSMTIGGTQSTINTMLGKAGFNDVKNPALPVACAFACHDPSNMEGYTASTWCNANPADANCRIYGAYYCPFGAGACGAPVLSSTMTDHRYLAKIWGYQLKIDYVNSAINSFMQQLVTYNNTNPGRYTVGIDTFGSNADGAGNPFNILLAPTANMTTAAAAASTIDVEAAMSQAANFGYTYTTIGLTSALSNIKNIGDGSSASKMKTYVIFLSDGVEDLPAPPVFGGYGRSADLNYTTACTALKNAGVSVFSIWASYYALTGDAQYNMLVAPLSPQMPTTMQACASSQSQYFAATDGPAITAAVNSTFNTIINNSNLRLSQ